MGKLKSVLLVDDDDTTNFLNQFFIRQVDSSIEINVALNGKEALDFLVLNGNDDILPCLLILDTNMPIMNGWEFLADFDIKFNADFKKNVTIVMLTSLDIEHSIKKAIDNPNVSDTEQKPLSDLKFRALIKKHF
ncbi:MAG: response regulator [Bacteroidota bacterium]